jgi:hypothetical protein
MSFAHQPFPPYSLSTNFLPHPLSLLVRRNFTTLPMFGTMQREAEKLLGLFRQCLASDADAAARGAIVSQLKRLVYAGANLLRPVKCANGACFVPFLGFVAVADIHKVPELLQMYIRRCPVDDKVRLKRMVTDLRLYLNDAFGAADTARALYTDSAAAVDPVRVFANRVEHADCLYRAVDMSGVDDALVASIAAACDRADKLRAFAVEWSGPCDCNLLCSEDAQAIGKDARFVFLPHA